jgi:hypothetical protein
MQILNCQDKARSKIEVMLRISPAKMSVFKMSRFRFFKLYRSSKNKSRPLGVIKYVRFALVTRLVRLEVKIGYRMLKDLHFLFGFPLHLT